MLSQLIPALRATIILALLTGILFPIVMTSVCEAIFPYQANGSLIRDQSGQVIGSQLLAQSFARPQYFHPRLSAAGSGYAGEASAGSNLGPTSRKLLDNVNQLVTQYRAANELSTNTKVPVDAVTKSGSGLDPDISLQNAMLQAKRVAKARAMSEDRVVSLINQHLAPRTIGIFGEPRVNVLSLNLALDNGGKVK